MQTISLDNIRECITAGRVVEARTRLTMEELVANVSKNVRTIEDTLTAFMGRNTA